MSAVRLQPKTSIATASASVWISPIALTTPRRIPCYMGLTCDGVELRLSSFSGDGVAGGVVFLLVDDVDALRPELVAKGVTISLEPTDQSWGNREM